MAERDRDPENERRQRAQEGTVETQNQLLAVLGKYFQQRSYQIADQLLSLEMEENLCREVIDACTSGASTSREAGGGSRSGGAYQVLEEEVVQGVGGSDRGNGGPDAVEQQQSQENVDDDLETEQAEITKGVARIGVGRMMKNIENVDVESPLEVTAGKRKRFGSPSPPLPLEGTKKKTVTDTATTSASVVSTDINVKVISGDQDQTKDLNTKTNRLGPKQQIRKPQGFSEEDSEDEDDPAPVAPVAPPGTPDRVWLGKSVPSVGWGTRVDPQPLMTPTQCGGYTAVVDGYPFFKTRVNKDKVQVWRCNKQRAKVNPCQAKLLAKPGGTDSEGDGVGGGTTSATPIQMDWFASGSHNHGAP